VQNRKPIGIVLIHIYNGIGELVLAFVGSISAFASGLLDIPTWIPLLGFILLVLGCLYLATTYDL